MRPVAKPDGVRVLCPVDILALKKLVVRVSEGIWEREDAVKENAFACFHHTRHILFRFMEGMRDHRKSYDLPLWRPWQGHLMPVLARAVESFRFQEPVFPKVMLASLAPGNRIDRHTDGAGSNLYTHKIHVPLQTSPEVLFMVGDSRYRLEEGIAYEVNNLSPHAVENHGPVNRIHLIFEVYDGRASDDDDRVDSA